MGVIDPTKVLRVALQNSSSVAGSLIATDTLVVAMLNKV
jgi:chaperonin GroEL (HSP60 family)